MSEAERGDDDRAPAERARSPGLMLGARDDRVRGQLLGLGADQPARADVPGPGHARCADRVRRRAAGRGPGAGRLAGPDPRRRPDRPLRRPGHVPAGLGGDDRAGPVHRLRRPGLLRPAARRRLLPRHRRHRVRGRRPVRQRLVPPGAPRPGDRHLRRRHGRHRDQRPHHGEALHQRGREGAVPDHRRRPGGLRRGRLAGAARRARPRRPDDQPGGPAQRQRPARRSPGRRASSTPSPSAGTSPSRSTCRPTSRPRTG